MFTYFYEKVISKMISPWGGSNGKIVDKHCLSIYMKFLLEYFKMFQTLKKSSDFILKYKFILYLQIKLRRCDKPSVVT